MSAAGDFYSVAVERKPRWRRLATQFGFWFGAAIGVLDGHSGGVPPSGQYIVIRDLSGKVVTTIDEVSELGEPMLAMVTSDLERLSATDFATEWGLGN